MAAVTFNRTQIYLSAEQQTTLADMARQIGSSSSALIRQAIDAFIAAKKPSEIKRLRREAMDGSWKDNDFDFVALRREERQLDWGH